MAFRPDGLVAKLKFGQGLSIQRRGTIIDQSDKGNKGTVYGVPALSFDGVDDKAAVSTRWDSLGGYRYAVFAGWIYLTAPISWRMIWAESWSTAGNNNKFIGYFDNTAKLVMGGSSASGDTYRSCLSTNAITADTWHSILAVMALGAASPWTPTAYVWVDGAVFPMGAFGGNLTQGTFSTTNGTPAFQAFGLDSINTTDCLGYMQWLGLGGKDTLPTIADAQRFHDLPQTWLASSGLPGFWYCKEATGSTVDNAEGTASRDLTLTGTTWNMNSNGGDSRLNSAGAGDSFTDGKLWFDGTNDYVAVTDGGNFTFGTAPFQMHIWLSAKAGVVASERNLIWKNWGADTAWTLQITSGVCLFKSNGATLSITGGSDIRGTGLHLVSVLRNGSTCTLYLDGVQLATDAVNGNQNFSKDSIVNIGGLTSFFAGDIYQVLIGTANKTIAQANADMQAIYAQGAYV